MSFLRWLPQTMRELRRGSGLTQRQLAQRARQRGMPLTQAMISQWERGSQRPTMESLDGLLDALGVSLAEYAAVTYRVEREHEATEPEDGAWLEAERSRWAASAALDVELQGLIESFSTSEAVAWVFGSVGRTARRALLLQQMLTEEKGRLVELLEGIKRLMAGRELPETLEAGSRGAGDA